MTDITYSASAKLEIAADAVLTFVFEKDLQSEERETLLVQRNADDRIRSLYKRGLFKAARDQVEVIPSLGLYPVEHIVFVGVEEGGGINSLRHAAAAAAKALKRIQAKQVHVLLRDHSAGQTAFEAEAAAQAITEGLLLALHDRQPLKKEHSERFQLDRIHFLQQSDVRGEASEQSTIPNLSEQWNEGIRKGQLYAEAVQFARDLTNMPGNNLTPERLAFHAEQLASELDLEIEVIDEWSAAEEGMGGLLGVGQGSVNPPRMIIVHYNGNPDSSEVWGLVGKGITFDTGGISLKRAAGMEEMISDMGGAAAVLGAVHAIAKLKAAVNFVAVIPTAENMPSDRALKPGDVLQTMSGYTVEVVNTDAEGRLVLADGLTAAIRRGATRLVDVATLTGAVGVALGTEATGAVTNNEALMGEVLRAGERAGERIWQLPAYPEYKKQLKSDAADLKNSGGRYAGTITGGLFIGHFAEGLPWVHLDIAGTAWLESGRGWEPKGATGVMVRTLVELMTN